MDSSPRQPAPTPSSERNSPRQPQLRRATAAAGWRTWVLLASAIVLVVGSLAVSAALVVAGTDHYRSGQGDAAPTKTPAQTSANLPAATEVPASPSPTEAP